MIWTILNSPAVIATVVSAVALALGRLYLAEPVWKVWEGTIVSAIKHAEKMIPDNSTNKGLAKLDEALRYVLAAHARITGKTASRKLSDSIRNAIPIIHARLDAKGRV